MALIRIIVVVLLAAACGGDEPASDSEPTVTTTTAAVTTTSTTAAETSDAPTPPGDQCAHVVDATIDADSSGGYVVSATVRSADTGWEKYADAWEIRGPDGTVLGERVLAHPHETEQPFTRSQSGVQIPAGVSEVTIAAHDSVVGFCGDVFVLQVPQQ